MSLVIYQECSSHRFRQFFMRILCIITRRMFILFLYFSNCRFVVLFCVKVPYQLSDETYRFPTSSRPVIDVSTDSNEVSPSLVSSPASKQSAGDLSLLLDALDRNLAEQGVIVQPKGECAACSKPIIGRVSNVKVVCVYLIL